MTGCDPSVEKGPVGDKCGVFVSSSKGSDSNDGSKAKPFKTIGKALGAKKDLYLCGEKFDEAVELAAGTSLFGGLKCASDWSYDAKTKSTITATDKIVVKVSGMSGSTTVQDIAVTAGDAMVSDSPAPWAWR